MSDPYENRDWTDDQFFETRLAMLRVADDLDSEAPETIACARQYLSLLVKTVPANCLKRFMVLGIQMMTEEYETTIPKK